MVSPSPEVKHVSVKQRTQYGPVLPITHPVCKGLLDLLVAFPILYIGQRYAEEGRPKSQLPQPRLDQTQLVLTAHVSMLVGPQGCANSSTKPMSGLVFTLISLQPPSLLPAFQNIEYPGYSVSILGHPAAMSLEEQQYHNLYLFVLCSYLLYCEYQALRHKMFDLFPALFSFLLHDPIFPLFCFNCFPLFFTLFLSFPLFLPPCSSTSSSPPP